jgi:Tfp pilus assembly protein PilF
LSIDPPARLNEALSDRYRIEEKVGEGGMSLVYLATDLKHDRKVAFKVLRPEIAAAVAGERFLAEIRLTARLQHPNILPLFDSGSVDGLLFYVMPFVEGETLQARLEREGALDPDEALRIAEDVAGALDHAHELGIVHRDVKPGNILLTRGKAMVGDFGIALGPHTTTTERLTEIGATPGTSQFMSPEQASGLGVDARSDVYSLGCVVFEMLAGRPPFDGPNDHVVRLKHATEQPPRLASLSPAIPGGVDAAVAAALSKEPAARPDSATEFVRSMRAQSAGGPNARRSRWVFTMAALALAAVFWAGIRALGPDAGLDSDRVLIYPLVVSEAIEGRATLGEDLATLVGNALDGVGPLRWIDGWTLLGAEEREDVRGLSLDDARAIAVGRGSGFFVTGRIIPIADSVEVLLDLNDAATGEVAARGRAAGPADQAWRAALGAVIGLLPTLVPGVRPDAVEGWRDRHPLAIANFLLGEAAFRRVRHGEALAHYRDAVEQDPAFGIAAIRGAQAATWNHRASEAASLLALALEQPLPDRYARFGRGFDFYLRGQADSAAAQFRGALQLDPAMTVAWMQLGEVYTHLLPLGGNPDSLADAAFREARQLDPSAANILLHPIEFRLRDGRLGEARAMLDRFLEGSPDPVLAGKLEIMAECLGGGAEDVPWIREAEERTLSLLYGAHAMSASPASRDCAAAAYDVLLSVDTAATGEAEGRRWASLVGQFALAATSGNSEAAVAHVDGFVRRWGFGSTVFLLAAPVMPEVRDRAWEVAEADRETWGADYAGCPFPRRLWELGVLEAVDGSLEVAQAVMSDLRRRSEDSTGSYERGLADSMEALVLLARGDTAAAAEALEAVVTNALVLGELAWDEAQPRAFERLTLARLHLALGDPRRALSIASVFDSAWPMVHALYLPASLELRIAAAEALGNDELASEYTARLASLRGGA